MKLIRYIIIIIIQTNNQGRRVGDYYQHNSDKHVAIFKNDGNHYFSLRNKTINF